MMTENNSTSGILERSFILLHCALVQGTFIYFKTLLSKRSRGNEDPIQEVMKNTRCRLIMLQKPGAAAGTGNLISR